MDCMNDDLWTGLVFYGRDLSEDGTIFYTPVVDRLEIYLFFLQIFRPVGLHCCSYVLRYFTDGMDCHVFCGRDDISDLL